MKTSKYLLTGILFLFAFNLLAQIPETISFQGILKDNNGDIVADASYTMEFELYDAITAGTSVWGPESHSVPTIDGLYSVDLGSNGTAITNSTEFKSGYFLQIKVNGEILAPRITLTVSPYAFIARSIQGSDNVMPSSGNVGIGTIAPTTKLDVAGTVTATEFVGGGAGLTGTIADARLESTIDISRLNTSGGLHVGGTSDPGVDNLDVDGFTQLGTSSISVSAGTISHPAIKVLVIEGATASTLGGTSSTTLTGMTDSKIISIEVLVEYTTDDYMHPGFTSFAGFQFDFNYQSSILNVRNSASNSSSILSKPFKATITYTN